MSALTYLTLTRLKNGIRDLLRKPARLIYVVFLLALLVFAVQGSDFLLGATGVWKLFGIFSAT